MTIAVGTEIGTGSGLSAGVALGVELPTGAGAEIDSGIGAGEGFGAAFERAGGNGVPDETAALAAGKDASRTWLNAAKGSETPNAGKESFKADWQSMLRAWAAPVHPGDETREKAAGQSDQTEATNRGGSGQSAGSIGVALAFGCRGTTQWAPAAGGRNGSTASASIPVNQEPTAKQSATNGPRVAAGTESAAAWNATKTTGSIGSSPGISRIEKRNSLTQNAGVQGQAAQGVNGAAGSPVDGYAAQAAVPIEASIQRNKLIESAGPGFPDGVDDQAGIPAAAAEQPALRSAVAWSGAKNTLPAAPATAAANSGPDVRAAEQIPIHAAQTSPSHQTMNPCVAGAVEMPGDDQEEFAAIPQSSLTAAEVATTRGPEAVSAMDARTTSGMEEQKSVKEPGAGGLAGHRPAGETSGTSAAPRMQAAGSDKSGLEAVSLQTPVAKTTHDAAAGGAIAAASQKDGAHVVVARDSGMQTSAIVHDPAGVHDLATSAASAVSTSAEAPAAAQETFAALDAGTTVGSPTWAHAGGRQAEAGFEDPALGWVGVRADLSGGSVHATVVPGSTDAAQALSGHLAGLSAYLSENHTPVATLIMSAPGNSGIEAGPDQSSGHGMGQGMQQSAGQHGEQNHAPALQMESQPDPGVSSSATGGATPASGFDATAYAHEGRGTHISVMA